MKRKNNKKLEELLLKIAIEYCLICPNCDRIMPNLKFRRIHGCQWCVPEHRTKDSNGHY